MNWAIVGAGGVGAKRAVALGGSVKLVADPDLERAKKLMAPVTADWKDILGRKDVDAVVIATPNHLLAPIALAFIEAGKHVLIEKPGARTAAELREVADAAKKKGVQVQIGYNHVFHPGIAEALRLVTEPVMFLRARYGHGGRIGYDKEWRADPKLSGGGELIDQGVHLIHLARKLMGDFPVVEGHVATYFWDMPVEDNAFLSLRTADGRTAWLHASCTEWKNMFSLEIYTRTMKIQVDGLGGSYGVETLTVHRMKPEMGPPVTETKTFDMRGGDGSWRHEIDDFMKPSNLPDAIAVLDIVGKLYK